jgi:hypothetical protein
MHPMPVRAKPHFPLFQTVCMFWCTFYKHTIKETPSIQQLQGNTSTPGVQLYTRFRPDHLQRIAVQHVRLGFYPSFVSKLDSLPCSTLCLSARLDS